MLLAKIFFACFNIDMGVLESFKKLCIKLGKSNKPTYAVMAIATVKGIARPIFTMMDKDEDPETKKYTALREGLTEVVAIPTYWGCGELTAKVANHLNLTPDKKAIAKHNFMFLGVCAAALLVIPAVTSLIIKPVMKEIKKSALKKEEKLNRITQPEFTQVNNPTFKSKKLIKPNYSSSSFGALKVGGV